MSDGAWALKTRVDLCIACCYTPTHFAKDDRGVIARARDVLDGYNIGLWVWPEETAGQKGGGNMLHGYTSPIKNSKEAYQALRRDMYELIRRSCNRRPVAFVVFSQYEHHGYGIAPELFTGIAPVVGKTPGCLISPSGNTDCMDLLHELGHCAGLDHVPQKDNFMGVADGRSTILQAQGERLAKSVFAW